MGLDFVAETAQSVFEFTNAFAPGGFAVAAAREFDRLAEGDGPASAEEREPVRPAVKFSPAEDDTREDRHPREFGDTGDAVLERSGGEHRGVASADPTFRKEPDDATGAFPTARLDSAAIALSGRAIDVEQKLRLSADAVIGRIVDDRLLLDLRSITADQDEAFAAAVITALAG